MLVSLDLQIIALAREGLAAEEIAKAIPCELSVVDFTLRRTGMIQEDEISDDEFEEIRKGLLNIATTVVEDSVAERAVRAKVGMFLYERKKGKPKDFSKAPAVNIENLNLLIASSHERVLKSVKGISDDSIRRRVESAVEVPAEPQTKVEGTG